MYLISILQAIIIVLVKVAFCSTTEQLLQFATRVVRIVHHSPTISHSITIHVHEVIVVLAFDILQFQVCKKHALSKHILPHKTEGRELWGCLHHRGRLEMVTININVQRILASLISLIVGNVITITPITQGIKHKAVFCKHYCGTNQIVAVRDIICHILCRRQSHISWPVGAIRRSILRHKPLSHVKLCNLMVVNVYLLLT